MFATAAFAPGPDPLRRAKANSAHLLDGIAVVDLTRNLPGPYCTRLLADLGASVVKVEPPSGDPVRAVAWYDLLNHGKRIVVLDLALESSRQELDELLARADVCVEGFKPETARTLGVDGATLAARHPHLVHCAISGFGQSGQDADRAAHDLNYQAMAGLLGPPRSRGAANAGSPPGVPRLLLADLTGSLHAAIAILAALVARGPRGVAQRLSAGDRTIDISLQRAAQSWLPFLDPPRINGDYACYNVYQTADEQWVALGALERKFWERFCRHVGREDWIVLQFAEEPIRSEVLRAVTMLFRSRTSSEWTRDLTPIDCCYSPLTITPA